MLHHTVGWYILQLSAADLNSMLSNHLAAILLQ